MSGKHTIRIDGIVGEFSRVMATDGTKFLYAVVSIDKHGGHRHSFLVETPERKWRTESITEAIRIYNEEGGEFEVDGVSRLDISTGGSWL